VAILTRLSRIAAITMLLGAAASAQDPVSFSFKMGGGPTFEGIKNYTGQAGFGWGGEFECAVPITKSSQFAISLGYRFFPGDFQQLSLAPATSPTRTTAGTYLFETRMRKADLQGFQLGFLYRSDFAMEGLYWQGGLRCTFSKTKEVDTGTIFTQTVTTVPGTGSITAVTAIASSNEKTALQPGLLVGAGYRFNDTYSLEANYYTVRATSPSAGTRVVGSASELIFGIRF